MYLMKGYMVLPNGKQLPIREADWSSRIIHDVSRYIYVITFVYKLFNVFNSAHS